MPLLADNPARQLQYRLADLQDPSLMSLPNPHGFSAPLWQRTAPAASLPEHPAPAPAFLETDIPRQERPLLAPPALADAARTSAARSSVAFTDMPTTDTGAEDPPTTALDCSSMEINHGLEQLRLLTVPAPPTIPSETPLRPTHTRLAVAADGTVRYAMIERSSGSENADAQALRIVRALRFAPRLADDFSSGGRLTWGAARFVWATRAP